MFEQFAPYPKPFALDGDDAERVARILWAATHVVWGFCISGGTDYLNKTQRRERMKDPQPGDLVAEQSGGLRQFDCAQAVGWLEKVTREPMPFEEWDEEADGPIPTEAVWYITALDGRQCRWTNCTFFPVPTYPGWWDAERWQHKDRLAAVANGETPTPSSAQPGDA